MLSSPVTLNQYIQIACLPSQSTSFPQDGLTGVVTGWGASVYDGPNTDLLQNVRLDIYNNATCESYGYDPSLYSNNYTSSFCAG